MGSVSITPDSLRTLAAGFDKSRARADAARSALATVAGSGSALGKPDLAEKYAQGEQQAQRIATDLGTTLGDHARALRQVADAMEAADARAASLLRPTNLAKPR